MISPNKIRSFTLVELLIVIAILAILAAAVVIVINPGEMIAEARDTQRITDTKNLKDAADLLILDDPTTSFGIDNRVYISIPDTSVTCDNILSSLPTLPSGWLYRCVTTANLRNTDGSGWLPLNLSSIKGGSPIPYLPIDPINDVTTNKYYQFIPKNTGRSYELTAIMESEKQAKAAAKDGGSDPGRFEAGTNMTLWRTASGLAGYWPMEGSGNIANSQTLGLEDFSGNNNNGVASNVNGAGMTFETGKQGSAVKLASADDLITIPDNSLLNGKSLMSISMWIRRDSFSAWCDIISSGDVLGRFEDTTEGEIRIYNAGIMSSLPITTGATTGSWHYLTLTADGTNVKTYLNGIQYASFSQAGAWTGSANIYLGVRFPTSNRWYGAIDELRIYNRALTATEVKAIYNAAK